MQFVKIWLMRARDKYLHILQEPSDSNLKDIFILASTFKKLFDHNPRDAVINGDNLLMDDNQSNIGENKSYFFMNFVLFQNAFLVASFYFFILHRLKLWIDKFHRSVDVSEKFSLCDFPKW